jgi:glucosyl-3-phosphoglycerate synthase
MADFHQAGSVATLHRLDPGNLHLLEQEIEAHARRHPIALVLPCLFSEFSRPAIRHIIEELRHVRYIDTVVVSLGRASGADLPVARRAFARLPQRVAFVWNDGPALQALYARLREHGLPADQDGKGRSCWIAYGYVLADGRCEVIACHDCDITTYSRELVARLCYPVVNSHLGFDFAKGYYARVGYGLNGRVTRLFVTPLVRALQRVAGDVPFLSFLDGFRYVLSGEFAMRSDLARVNRLPSTWGLEIGALAEVFRNRGPRRVCQTELCANYDHKHQAATSDPDTGLLRMCVDVAGALLRAVAAEGVVLSEGLLRTLSLAYARRAEDAVDCYAADAAINSLSFDRHAEEQLTALFGRGLAIASERHLVDPAGAPLIPSWERVASAIPGFLDQLRDAVHEDSLAVAAA